MIQGLGGLSATWLHLEKQDLSFLLFCQGIREFLVGDEVISCLRKEDVNFF